MFSTVCFTKTGWGHNNIRKRCLPIVIVFAGPQGEVWSTETTVSGSKWLYALGMMLAKDYSLSLTVPFKQNLF